ncbi:TPA: M23 family metallopeptidase [Candidatus Poribacteria bacterium]|nr:M23 family metallopeptidase [Candidatus Poribacteria bacterium]
MRANDITPRDYLVIGQTLIIPKFNRSTGEGREAKIPSPLTSVPRSVLGGLRLMCPLPGGARMTSPFGWRIHPITGRREFHRGVDLAARIGTPVRAATAGRVIFAGRLGGYGLAVIIEHKNSISTLYGHLSVISVGLGQRVKGGERIGFSGNSGLSTGPHLHFEVRVKDEPVDPRRFIRF